MNRILSRLNDEHPERLRPLRSFPRSKEHRHAAIHPVATPRRLPVPRSLHVEVEDGIVGRVTIIDETPVRDPVLVEGNPADLDDAVRAADDGQAWPSWQFGY